MYCQQSGCNMNAKASCIVHSINLCNAHCNDHTLTCDSKPISFEIAEESNSLQGLIDIEQKFNLEEFKAKAINIKEKFESLEVVTPKAAIRLVDSVFESLEKLDLKGKIAWCKDENFVMIDDYYLNDIKITKDAKFVFVCKFKQSVNCKKVREIEACKID